jgi:hypothetical protein
LCVASAWSSIDCDFKSPFLFHRANYTLFTHNCRCAYGFSMFRLVAYYGLRSGARNGGVPGRRCLLAVIGRYGRYKSALRPLPLCNAGPFATRAAADISMCRACSDVGGFDEHSVRTALPTHLARDALFWCKTELSASVARRSSHRLARCHDRLSQGAS